MEKFVLIYFKGSFFNNKVFKKSLEKLKTKGKNDNVLTYEINYLKERLEI